MVKSIYIKKYRKLKDLNFEFEKSLNLISGTNGTCKTSILYLISNSYKKVTQSTKPKEMKNCLKIINSINNLMNPKIESLTRGDKVLNDPAPGIQGEILEVSYENGSSLKFRKHNSESVGRYAVKPNYKRGAGESLPEIPVIYLGLSRLISFGELGTDNSIKKVRDNLPEAYRKEVIGLYSSFTGIQINEITYNDIGGIKTRGDFTSQVEGIDSNTISAGEDNLYIIITALVSLKYYYEQISSASDEIKSILVIDELDATLHPSYQIKLYNLIEEYTEKYGIQFFATTHALNLLEHALEKQANVFYLLDQVDYIETVTKRENLDIFSIKTYLERKTSSQVIKSTKIPVFLEDDEARVLLERIFDYLSENIDPDFKNVRSYFHIVDCKIGSENLRTMFKDTVLINDLVKAICILDGDADSELVHNIITLPGKKNPELLLVEYLKEIYSSDEELHKSFWKHENPLVHRHGYQKGVAKEQILDVYEGIINEQIDMSSKGISTKGFLRKKMKPLFNTHELLFIGLFDLWLTDEKNKGEVNQFRKNLNIMFKKTALAHNINKKLWDF